MTSLRRGLSSILPTRKSARAGPPDRPKPPRVCPGERTWPVLLRAPPDAIRRKAAILFIDLSGFTGVSERIGLDGTLAILADFYGIVETTVLDEGGVVLNYLGDGALVAFGSGPECEDARSAVQAALRLLERVSDWISRQPEHRALAGVRIGAHVGEVLVARLGGVAHRPMTILGDNVNVASRLLELAPARGSAIVFSKPLLDAAGPALPEGAQQLLRAGRLAAIRGRSERLVVHIWTGTSMC